MIDQKSIAVLPFDNLSSDPENEYFSDGMTEEIINALSKIEGLKVTARTSSFAFKHQKIDVRHIGNQLGVASVLEGSVRKSGKRVRITAQLIRTDNGFHIWSENFDRHLNDIFALQDEVSLLIADKIRENFGHISVSEHLVKSETNNIEAYNWYLKGRFYQLKWDWESFKKAIDCYEKSIGLDPDYPLPYLAASQTYAYLSSWGFMPKEEGHQLAAQNLAHVGETSRHLAEYHFAMLTKAFWSEWDFSKANEGLSVALERFPNATDLLELGAEIYTAQGEFERALKLIDKALVLNPLSPNHHYTKGNVFYLSGKYQEALTSMNRSIELDANWVLAIHIKACCYLVSGDQEGLEMMLPQMNSMAEQRDFQLLSRLMQGDDLTIQLTQEQEQGYIPWHVYLLLYSGQPEKAMDKLEWGVNRHMGQYIGFLNDPLLKPLRSHERYQNLISPQYITSPSREFTEVKASVSEDKMTTDEVESFKAELFRLMSEEKAYLNSSLSLRELAEIIDLHPNKLSWLMNDQLGKNFNELVNQYRLEEFQKRSTDPANKHITLLGLAYESGFNSKSVFNDFFKKQTGQTPKAWIKSYSIT